MMGMFSSNDAIGGNIVAHGCHFRVMFKTKGFSSNSSLKRRGIIVDAPDLPPEECEFFITSHGIADTEEIEIPDADEFDFEIEDMYEEEEQQEEDGENGAFNLTEIKGIGKGTAESLRQLGINSLDDLLDASPEDLSDKVNGASEKTVQEWQKLAKEM